MNTIVKSIVFFFILILLIILPGLTVSWSIDDLVKINAQEAFNLKDIIKIIINVVFSLSIILTAIIVAGCGPGNDRIIDILVGNVMFFCVALILENIIESGLKHFFRIFTYLGFIYYLHAAKELDPNYFLN